MGDEEVIRLDVRLLRGVRPMQGSLTATGMGTVAFSGWLELIPILESLVDQGSLGLG